MAFLEEHVDRKLYALPRIQLVKNFIKNIGFLNGKLQWAILSLRQGESQCLFEVKIFFGIYVLKDKKEFIEY